MAQQVWMTNTLGGYMWSPNLSKVLRNVVQPLVKFRQFADVKDAAVQAKAKATSSTGTSIRMSPRAARRWWKPV